MPIKIHLRDPSVAIEPAAPGGPAKIANLADVLEHPGSILPPTRLEPLSADQIVFLLCPHPPAALWPAGATKEGRKMADKSTASPSLPKLLTLQQVAHITEFSVRQIRRWIDSGELAACRFGRSLRVAEPDLALFIVRNKSR